MPKLEQSKRTILVVIRFDDYSSISPLDLEKRILESFEKRGLVSTFCVVPYQFSRSGPQKYLQLTPEKIEVLKDAARKGIIEISQHGYSHEPTCLTPAGDDAEFLGQSYEEQYARIAKGKSFLEAEFGCTMETFSCPWNTYDSTTLNVITDLDFRLFSGMYTGPILEDSSVKYLPTTGLLKHVPEAVASARKLSDPLPVIVPHLHCRDFEPNVQPAFVRTSFQEFETVLDWLCLQKDVRVVTLAQAMKIVPDLSARRYLSYKNAFRLRMLFPPFLRDRVWPKAIYLSVEDIHRLRPKFYSVIGAYYSLIAVLGILFVRLARFWFPFTEVPVLWAFLVSSSIESALVIHLIVRNRYVWHKGATLVAAIAGISAGLGTLCFPLLRRIL